MKISNYKQGNVTVQAMIPAPHPQSNLGVVYCMADGNEIVAEGTLSTVEFGMLTDPDKGCREDTIAEHIYDWLV